MTEKRMRHRWRFVPKLGMTICLRPGCKALKSPWTRARSCRVKKRR